MCKKRNNRKYTQKYIAHAFEEETQKRARKNDIENFYEYMEGKVPAPDRGMLIKAGEKMLDNWRKHIKDVWENQC